MVNYTVAGMANINRNLVDKLNFDLLKVIKGRLMFTNPVTH